ncbi:conserved hypothetical protein [Trichinella spiralis]|uniref:hypothetical protein n=1 Tax=Trichinella spiralis TaxID=6334 RepID=UPI0001EFD42B|nr:conserved hypothetical protein [Trichinella spiralis]
MNNGEKRILNAFYTEQKTRVTKHNNRMQEVCVIFCQSGFCNSSFRNKLGNKDEIIVSAVHTLVRFVKVNFLVMVFSAR